ncbi:uncharacterized protein LOC117342900 [Pecten maximus]|uniref:uncharacterized protein LOC117342900 n=1 Tax=Pecten maximus TaxID=6579 RepID=UPI0014585DEF|nr:uncharacterized protein LOC117342900 [Pecten maximus]
MDINKFEETNTPLNPGSSKRVTVQTIRLRLILYRVGTCVGVSLLLAEVCLMVFTGLHLVGNYRTNQRDGSFQGPDAVTFVKCNRSSPCPVIRQESYVTLLKLMFGMKQQHDIRTHIKQQRGYLRNYCQHFTISGCTGGPLRWIPDFHGRREDSNGSVTIRTNGTYGMYNIFTLSSLHKIYSDEVKIIHRIHLDTPERHSSNESVLFENDIVLHTQRKSYESSIFFDFVYLREGDRVYPTISNTSFLYGMQKASRWGVFQVN